MRIKNIQFREEGDHVVLSADCTLRSFGSDTVYFKFDKRFKDLIVADASPFAAALLIPAMKLGQDIFIQGEISEKLYKGLNEIKQIVLGWGLGLKPISIYADSMKKDSFTSASKKASFFSGGVDSFYTYLKNKEIGNAMDYIIIANGYDISLANKKLWQMARESVHDAMKGESVGIIEVETNVRTAIDPIMDWSYTFGGCLAALGLCLRRELSDVFIASAYSHAQSRPDGAHPDTDPLWGTETISFHHDGADTSRLHKTVFIAKSPSVLRNLRVCFRNKDSRFNCGSCDKCMRTMIALRIAGALDKSDTFPRDIDLDKVRNLKIHRVHAYVFQEENLAELKRLGIEPALQLALEEALKKATAYRSYMREMAMQVWFLDYFYNKSRIYAVANVLRGKSISKNGRSGSSARSNPQQLDGILHPRKA